jgi:hypothetical protein
MSRAAARRGAGVAGAGSVSRRRVSRRFNTNNLELLEGRRMYCMAHGMPNHPVIEEAPALVGARAGGTLNAAPTGEPADIVWTNRANTTTGGTADTDGFGRVFGTTAPRARAVVDALIEAYERMIGSFNYPVAGEHYNLEVSMNTDPGNPWGGAAWLNTVLGGKPKSGGFVFCLGNNSPDPNDDNGWFLDSTPYDNSEFAGPITNAFTGNAQPGSPAFGRRDFYTVAAAELTHCMGQVPLAGFSSLTTNTGVADLSDQVGSYWVFRGPSVKHLMTSNNGGQDSGIAIHTAGSGGPGTNQPLSFGGDVYYGTEDQGRANYAEGQRYLVNQVASLMFKDAYGYSSVNPAQWGTTYSILDQTTRTVLVRGGDFANGQANSNDRILITRSGNTISVSVDCGNDVPGSGALPGVGDLPAWVTQYDISQVSSINIDAGAGNDVITIGTNIGVPITAQGGAGSNVMVIEGTDLGDTVNVRFDGFSSSAGLGGATTNVSMLGTFASINIFTRDGGDGVSVREMAANRLLNVYLGDDLDTMTLTQADAHNYPTLILVDGGTTGTDKLFIEDGAVAGTSTYTVTNATVTKNNGFGGIQYIDFENVFINGENGSNTINVNSTQPTTSIYLNGGATADTYNINETAGNSYAVISSGAGGDTLNVNTDNTGSAQALFLSSVALRDLTLGVNGRATMSPHGNHVLTVNNNFLFLGTGALLEMNDNDFIYDYSGSTVLQAILNVINWARAGGSWSGNVGMTSSSAKNNPAHNTTLGIMEARDYKLYYGANATFDGQAIDDTAVLVKYTYYGDADFNGRVNFDDYVRTDTGFNQHKTGWFNGDYDGNGVVNFDDYVLIDLAFNTQGAAL